MTRGGKWARCPRGASRAWRAWLLLSNFYETARIHSYNARVKRVKRRVQEICGFGNSPTLTPRMDPPGSPPGKATSDRLPL